MLLKPDRLGDILELRSFHRVKALAALGEFLVDLDDRLSHLLVSVLSPTRDYKIVTGGDTLMPVGIHTEPYHQ